jgi:Putative cyclase
VLIDYYAWAQEHEPYNPLEAYSISLINLEKCIRSQNVEFLPADILLIRFGFTQEYSKLDTAARELIASSDPHHFAGVEQSEAILEWLWNHQFAAVAGDAPSFEVWRT